MLRSLTPRPSSRLAQLILVANFVALGVLVAGMLALTETRRGLVNAKLDSLRAQGELIANVLAEGASDGAPAPVLRNDDARAILRQLYVPEESRVLVFDRSGQIVADSHLLADVFETTVLPPPGPPRPDLADTARSLPNRILESVSDLFRSPEERAALDRDLGEEVQQVVNGDIVAGVRREADGRRVVSVSIPIQPVRAVVGVVTIESYDLDRLIEAERRALVPFIAIAVLVTVMSSLALTVFIARPVRRLARAAREARQAGGRRVKMPDLRSRNDEIGELGVALSEMTEALYDRLDAIESFARRRLPRAEESADLDPLGGGSPAACEGCRAPRPAAGRHHGRCAAARPADLRHFAGLAGRCGARARGCQPLRPGRPAVGTGRCLQRDRQPQGARGDRPARAQRIRARPRRPLGQVFRNLLDNAMTFSPEGGTVWIRLVRSHRGGKPRLLVQVDDEGPGIPPDNLETVFQRFYTDRPEGAAFGTHSGLGLAIARQIVEAHGGRITASNRQTEDGRIAGARFTVELPAASHD